MDGKFGMEDWKGCLERKVGSEEEDAGEGEGVVQQRRRRPQIDQAAHAVLHAAFAENPHRSGVCLRA